MAFPQPHSTTLFRRPSASEHPYAPPTPSPLSPFALANNPPPASIYTTLTLSHYYRPPRSSMTSPTRSNISSPTGSPTRTSRQTRIQSLLASDALLSRLTPATIARFANDAEFGFTTAEREWSLRAADGIVKVGEWLREVEGWNLNWRRSSGGAAGRDMAVGYLPPSPDRPKKRRKVAKAVAAAAKVEEENGGMGSIKEVEEEEDLEETPRPTKKVGRRLFVDRNADTSEGEEDRPEVVLSPPTPTSEAGRQPRKPMTPYQLKMQRQRAAEVESTPTKTATLPALPQLAPVTPRRSEAPRRGSYHEEELEEEESDEDGEEEEYWGSLRKSTVVKYEARIEYIKSEIEELDVEALKSKVLSYRTGTTNPLTDSSAIITATTLQLLPPLHRLTKLLSLWTVRLAVLRVVPVFLRWLGIAKVALDAGYTAINHPSISPSHPSSHAVAWRGLEEETYTLLQETISQKVATAGRLMDTMLDALEGREDILPDLWISELEDIEEQFGAWEMDGERVVLEGRLRLDDLRTGREELEREREKTALVLEQERSVREAEQVGVEVDGVMERAEETERGLREAMEANEVVAEGIELSDEDDAAASPVEGGTEWGGRELLRRLEGVEKMRMERSGSVSESETDGDWADASDGRRWGSISEGVGRHGLSLDPIQVERRGSAISTGSTPFMTPMPTPWFAQNGHALEYHGARAFAEIAPARSYQGQNSAQAHPAVQSHPVVAQVHPATVQAHPAVIQIHPATTQVHPATVQTHPAATQVHPATVQAHPAVIQIHPATIQVYPATTQVRPATVQTRPAIQTQPAIVQRHPATIQTRPSPTQIQPAQIHPATVQLHPITAQAHSAALRVHTVTVKHTTQKHPATVQPHPATTQIHPATVQAHPATTQVHPATVQVHPATRNARPTTPQQRPVTPRTPSPEIIRELPKILAAARSFFRVEQEEQVRVAQIEAEENGQEKNEEEEIGRLAELEVADTGVESEHLIGEAVEEEQEREEEEEVVQKLVDEVDGHRAATEEAEEAIAEAEADARRQGLVHAAETAHTQRTRRASLDRVSSLEAARLATESEHQRILAAEAALIVSEERRRLAEEREAETEHRLAAKEEAAAERMRIVAAAATATAVAVAAVAVSKVMKDEEKIVEMQQRETEREAGAENQLLHEQRGRVEVMEAARLADEARVRAEAEKHRLQEEKQALETARLRDEAREKAEAERTAEAEKRLHEQHEREKAARVAEEARVREEAERAVAADKRLREEREREEATRLAEEARVRVEAERAAEAEKRLQEEREREEAARLAEETRAREEAERAAETEKRLREEREREEATRLADEARAIEEAERAAEAEKQLHEEREREEVARLEEEARARAEAERAAEAEKRLHEEHEREKVARLAEQAREREEAERAAEAEKRLREEREREEAARLADEARAREEAERAAEAEKQLHEEREREEVARLEVEALARAEAERAAEAKRAAQIEAENQRLHKERQALEAARLAEEARAAEIEAETQRLHEEQEREKALEVEAARIAAEARARAEAEIEAEKRHHEELEREQAVESARLAEAERVAQTETERLYEEKQALEAARLAEAERAEAERKRIDADEARLAAQRRKAEWEAEDEEERRLAGAMKADTDSSPEVQRANDQSSQSPTAPTFTDFATHDLHRRTTEDARQRLLDAELSAREQQRVADQEAQLRAAEQELEAARLSAERTRQEEEAQVHGERHNGQNSDGGSVSGEDVTEEYTLGLEVEVPPPPPSVVVDETPVGSRSPSVEGVESPSPLVGKGEKWRFEAGGERKAHRELQRALNDSAGYELSKPAVVVDHTAGWDSAHEPVFDEQDDSSDFDIAPLATSTPTKPVRRLLGGRLSGLDSITEVLTPRTPQGQFSMPDRAEGRSSDDSDRDVLDTPSKRGKRGTGGVPAVWEREESGSGSGSDGGRRQRQRQTPTLKPPPQIKTQRSQRFIRKAPLDMSRPRSLSSTGDRPRPASAAAGEYLHPRGPKPPLNRPPSAASMRGRPASSAGERPRAPSAASDYGSNIKALPRALLKGTPKGALGPAMKAVRPRREADSDDEMSPEREGGNMPEWVAEPPRLSVPKHRPAVTPVKTRTMGAQEGTPKQTPKLQFPQQSLDEKVNEILTALASPVRLTASNLEKLTETTSGAGSGKRPPFRAPSSIPAPRSVGSAASDATTSFSRPTIAAARRHVPGTPGDIKLYHLHRSDGQSPIKLYIRLVGERGERVMVRVGGGWADLAEYLREYAAHHASKRRVVSEGRIEIQDLAGAHTRTLHPSRSVSSLRSNSPAPGSRSSSPLPPAAAARGHGRSRSSSALDVYAHRRSESPFRPRNGSPAAAPTSPPRVVMRGGHNGISGEPVTPPTLTPFQPMRLSPQSRPGSSHSHCVRRSASRLSFTEGGDGGDVPLGLAGPRGKGEISEEDQRWVQGMLGEVRKVSAGRRRRLTGGSSGGEGEVVEFGGGVVGVGEMGRMGGTWRVFPRKG